MSWAKLDDRFWANKKVRKAWRASRASIGLHVMAITYCAQNETDGHVDHELVEMLLPAQRDRDAAVAALVSGGLWDEVEGGFAIHDYLEFNDSREEIAAKVEATRRAKSEAGRKGAAARWQKQTSSTCQDSAIGSSQEPANGSNGSHPLPSPPIHVAPLPPGGKRARDLERYDLEIRSFVGEHFPEAQIGVVEHCASQLRSRDREPTVEALTPYVEHFTASPQEDAA